jgi:hypothetical protein
MDEYCTAPTGDVSASSEGMNESAESPDERTARGGVTIDVSSEGGETIAEVPDLLNQATFALNDLIMSQATALTRLATAASQPDPTPGLDLLKSFAEIAMAGIAGGIGEVVAAKLTAKLATATTKAGSILCTRRQS